MCSSTLTPGGGSGTTRAKTTTRTGTTDAGAGTARAAAKWARLPPASTAVAVSIAAWATVLLAPDAPWRAPLALAAAFWAPGHALLALAYPPGEGRLDGVERAGMAVVVSAVLLPVLTLAAGALTVVTPTTVTGGVAVATTALAAGASTRTRTVPTPLPRGTREAPLPGPRGTLALAGGAVAVAVVLVALPLGTNVTPHHLAILGPDGSPDSLPRALPEGTGVTLVVEAGAGDAAAAGRLLAHVEDTGTGNVVGDALVDVHVDVPRGERALVDVHVPPLEPAMYRVVARWDAQESRTVHVWITVQEVRR